MLSYIGIYEELGFVYYVMISDYFFIEGYDGLVGRV
jgi:hypothetical protein